MWSIGFGGRVSGHIFSCVKRQLLAQGEEPRSHNWKMEKGGVSLEMEVHTCGRVGQGVKTTWHYSTMFLPLTLVYFLLYHLSWKILTFHPPFVSQYVFFASFNSQTALGFFLLTILRAGTALRWTECSEWTSSFSNCLHLALLMPLYLPFFSVFKKKKNEFLLWHARMSRATLWPVKILYKWLSNGVAFRCIANQCKFTNKTVF